MLQEEPCWEALRDDYMMTSQTLKDWDKHSDDSAADEGSDAGSGSNWGGDNYHCITLSALPEWDKIRLIININAASMTYIYDISSNS